MINNTPFILFFFVFQLVSADYYTEFIKYDAQPDFSRIVITYETIRGHRGVDHFKENAVKYEQKNLFHTRGRSGDFREITRMEKMDGQEVKTIIKISPPRGMGMGGAVPNCELEVFINEVLMYDSTIGLNFDSNLNTPKIVIHVQNRMIETYTCDNTSGINYNFMRSSKVIQQPNQLTDDEVDTSLSWVTIWAIENIELLLIDPEGEEDTTIHEFKNMKIGDIEHVQFKESFRCYCSNVEAVRFRINGGVGKKIAGTGTGNFRWKDN